jgi:hypothetical protein
MPVVQHTAQQPADGMQPRAFRSATPIPAETGGTGAAALISRVQSPSLQAVGQVDSLSGRFAAPGPVCGGNLSHAVESLELGHACPVAAAQSRRSAATECRPGWIQAAWRHADTSDHRPTRSTPWCRQLRAAMAPDSKRYPSLAPAGLCSLEVRVCRHVPLRQPQETLQSAAAVHGMATKIRVCSKERV